MPSTATAYVSCGACNSCFIREDTLLNKVFVLMNDSEQVLMDYNINIGDTLFHTNSEHDTTKYTVSGIDSTVINSVYHKVWHFTLVPSHFAWAPFYSVIEGIGCTNGPLFVISPIDFESLAHLFCFYNNGTNPLVSPSVRECCSLIYFDNDTSCTMVIPSSASETNKTITSYAVYPNPTTSLLTITAADKITTISISNCLGQNIYHNQYNSTQIQVDVADLPAGVYFVKVNGSEVRKFLKQ